MALTASTRAALARQLDDLRCVFAEPLATRLGRSVDDIRHHALEAGDFALNESIELTLGDGSSMSLRHAFMVTDPAQRLVGVFTEHCGYHCFPMSDLHVVELRDGKVVREQRW